ncbi:zinc-binding alcohol dehydrogenase family protein [Oryzobacter terrae]|uniref:quinone oxidoreductase family protein n=1 Tax=Oryzobacter terrae TaxID=1620385 RepID=UPI0036705939
MRAAVITAHGRPPELVDRADPVAAEGQVLVAVAAVPLTPLDLLCATGSSYFGPPALPYVPGVQAVGTVLDGPADLVGARVWFPSSAGMAPGDGGLAELAVGRADEAVVVGDDVPATTVAALGLSAVAAWEVLEARAALEPGEVVLVLGAGGAVGQVAVQAARLLGARRVVAACRSSVARDRASACGADAVVDLGPDDDVATLAARLRDACEGGADVVVDPLAGVAGTAAVSALALGGRLVNLGSSAGPSLEVDSAALRSRSGSVLGYTNNALTNARRREVFATVLGHAARSRLEVAHDVVALADVGDAWAAVARGSAAARVVVTP